MEAYYIIGSTLAVCALLVSLFGVVRKGFPSSSAGEGVIAVVFVLLVMATIGAAIVGSGNEEHEEDEGGHEEAALVIPA